MLNYGVHLLKQIKQKKAMTTIDFSKELIKMEDSLERFALSLTSNREEAKDLLQETYLKALVYQDKFQEYTNLKAWAYTIMKNTFINNYRKMLRENTTIDHSKDLFILNSSRVTTPEGPDSTYSFKEINKAVNELEDEFRIPFQMHTEGFKYKEIADKLNLKIGTVKSRIFFTRKKLMESLKDFE